MLGKRTGWPVVAGRWVRVAEVGVLGRGMERGCGGRGDGGGEGVLVVTFFLVFFNNFFIFSDLILIFFFLKKLPL